MSKQPRRKKNMLMMLNLIVGTLSKHLRDRRGVVSVEWIILAIVIMVAIVAAFAPAFQQALKTGVQAVSDALTAQSGAAGS
jgi:Flp pilus assembly pilin Flp